MHACIRVLVRAPTECDAVREGQAAFDYSLRSYDRTSNGIDGPFDWAIPMNDDVMTAGSNRWSKYQTEPLAFELGMERGQEELRSAWSDTVEGIEENLKSILEITEEKSLSELQEDLVVRRLMGELHPFRPSPVYHLYDGTIDATDLVPITNQRAYEQLRNRVEDENWIVPLDAHF